MSVTTKKNHAENIPSKVAHGIREHISRGTLGPGVHLGQAELAKQFATSRVPIREALKLLVSEGLIQHDVNRGFFVASVSKDDAAQLYRVRYLLEYELLQTVPWPTAAQLEDLRARLTELDRLLTLGKRSEWAAQHRELACACNECQKCRFQIHCCPHSGRMGPGGRGGRCRPAEATAPQLRCGHAC